MHYSLVKLRERSGSPWGYRIGLTAAVALSALGLAQGPARGPSVPADFGQWVQGFQDDFNSPVRDPNWVAAPVERDGFQQTDGVLRVRTLAGDPNHLLYQMPGYDATAQEVLARIKVTAFGTAESSRAGIAVGVDPGTSDGINLLFIDAVTQPFMGAVLGRQFKLLDDHRAWGPPGLPILWQPNTWYWLRLRQDSSNAAAGPNIHAKVWRADGTVPEPNEWPLSWAPERRHGYAGLTASSGTLADFEVDYILIKATGLPTIKVGQPSDGKHWLILVQPPRDVTAAVGQRATLAAIAAGDSPPTYQWQVAPPGATDFTNIAGATGTNLATPVLDLKDHGTRYRCRIAIPGTTILSQPATVRVDTAPPELVSAKTLGRTDRVRVAFSEPISDRFSPADFAIDGGVRVLAVVKGAHPSQLELTTTDLAPGRSYRLTVNGITDPFGHAIKANTQMAIDSTPRDTFWYIGHTHWEGAVFQTREGFLEMGLPNILTALKLLKAYPNYKFVLDQVCYVKPFLERYPEEAAALQQFVKEGRLEIVGGIDTMHDNNIPCGESLVRQLLYGKGYYRERLGVEVTVGWGLDTFGHNAQTPQILRRAGYKSLWFARGVPRPDVPSEFIWQGLDGTQIPAFWLPLSYAVLYGSPQRLPSFTRFCQERFRALERFSRGIHRVGLAGADVSEPEAHVPEMVAAFNRQSDIPFEMRIGVPTEYEAAVAQRTDRPVIRGELNPIFQGGYSSRIELKQRLRHLEYLLLTAEKLGALLQGLGVPTDQEMVWRAWEPVLFNQAHDLASGVMTDRVYEDTLRGFDFSERLADEFVASRFQRLCDQIDTRGEGVPIVVFNPLGWVRTDVAEVEVGWTERGVLGVSLTDPSGQTVPAQIVQAQQYGDGGLKQARIAFLARQVPALGYSVYRAAPLRSKAEAVADPNQENPAGLMENEYYRMALDLRTGAITSLRVKAGNWEALSGPGNVVACQHDGGDLWELYQNLNAGSNIGMKRQQPVPKPGQAQFSHQYAGEPGTWRTGPVFSECQVSHPFTNGTMRTTVRLYAGLRRIDIRTRLLNNNLYVRYQVLFPSSIASDQNVQEIPFGAIQRPLGIEYPAQNWSSYGDAEKGLALLNRGLPGNLVNEGTLMLSLMRSARIAAYGYGGGYEPGMSSDTGLEEGQELTFDYALVGYAGDWRQAAVYRDGLEFNHPLLVRKAAAHAGKLPSKWGLLAVTPANVVISALKPACEGLTILRMYEASGQATSDVQFKFHRQVGAVFEANLMEDTIRPLTLQQGTARFDLAPFEIKTLKLQWHAAELD